MDLFAPASTPTPTPASLNLDPVAREALLTALQQGLAQQDEKKLKPETKVSRAVYSAHTLLYVRDSDRVYYLDHDVYRRLEDDSLMVWVRDAWEALLGIDWSAQQIDNTIKKIKKGVRKRINTMERNIIQVAADLFWDVSLAGFTTAVPEGQSCFCRLFDSTKASPTTILMPPLTPDQTHIIQEQHDTTLSRLQATQTLPEEYPFVTTWACGDHDVYMDMLRCHALTFMSNDKTGSPILIGSGGNGKSVYLDLLHSIWGRNNTTSLTMKQMADPHHQLSLAYSFVNAPDEDQEYHDKDRDEIQRTFKALSARSTIQAPTYFSQDDKSIDGLFVSFFPMNHKPTWRGTSVKALVRRSLIVPFNAELSYMTQKSGNFFHDTFTPDIICHYLGTLLGIATYYRDHDFTLSPVMEYHQASLLAENDSTVAYKQEFELFFDSFQKFEMIERDYELWCKAMDYPKQPLSSLRWTFNSYLEKQRTKCRGQFGHIEHGSKKQPLVYRARALDGKEQMVEGYNYPGIGRVEYLHGDDKRTSLVWSKAQAAKKAYGDKYKEVLRPKTDDSTSPPLEPLEQPPLAINDDPIFGKE